MNAEIELKPLSRGVEIGVAGVSHHQDVVAQVAIGTPVRLHHDLTNPHDPHAVAITCSAGLLGHVPRGGRVNERLLLGHRGGVWSGVVSDWTKNPNTGYVGVQVRVTELSHHESVAFGSQHTGLTSQPDDDLLPEVEAPTTTAAQTVTLKANGRPLGELLEFTGTLVRVRATNGTVETYPSPLVQVVDAA